MSVSHRHTKSSSYREYKREKTDKSRTRYYREKTKRVDVEPKTPPLLTRRASIEDLFKQRESLRQELKKIAKNSESDLKSKHKSSRYKQSQSQHSKAGPCMEKQSRKRRGSSNIDSMIEKKKHVITEPVLEPYGDHTLADSEDEETIIEQRRQQRKLLLEKLSMRRKDRFEQNYRDNINTSNVNSDDKDISESSQNSTFMKKTKASVKEIPDMFSEIDYFNPDNKPDQVTQDNTETNSAQLTDNWDDPDGYYNIKVGDKINKDGYVIKNILGQGVFANVVRAINKSNNTEVAIKIIRNNDLMYKTGLKEVLILKQIAEADPENKYHCIKFTTHFMHKSHLCIVLESLCMDLRCILKRYGKHGLNMKALASYSRQLLIALRFLKKIGIIHGDVKPDNILVNEKKNVLKLCDFGSAANADDSEATPYMVSRFYRAPEIILGIPYQHSIDVWSAACTIFEMATGKIMFAGSSNNKMLKCFMDMKGKFPTKMIRKGRFKDQHFNFKNNFILHKRDEFSGREKYTEVSNVIITRDLQKELNTYCKCAHENEEKKVGQLKDMLDKMIIYDVHQRYTATDCLTHPFIQEPLEK
ncbi:serine/threonine-protein kinase prp4-like [Hyposmocoma kahamanoa]|uniref:serine/threonine-protein kinase prp4-like n=1 Tax=Hyposmocoma kahamanoa TaxID=1477025 RepID=UPI000E6D799D|nr:serine/threonine-protein kinase prp4-like [Hyposmocoma kahamanoa]